MSMLRLLSWLGLASVVIKVVNDFRDDFGWFREGQTYGDTVWIVVVNEDDFNHPGQTYQHVYGVYLAEENARRAVESISRGFPLRWEYNTAYDLPGVLVHIVERDINSDHLIDMVGDHIERYAELEEERNRNPFNSFLDDLESD